MWIWLSHTLNQNTEGYKGEKSLIINNTSSINQGDSSNSVTFSMNNHLGSHVDVPYHFLNDGTKINEYNASDWVFNSPFMIEKSSSAAELLSPERFNDDLMDVEDVDLIIIRTGFEKFRGTKQYWESSPGFSSSLCDYLLKKFKSLKAIGLDTISLSSLKHREEGRKAHKILLSNGIRIFEDLKLSEIKTPTSLKTVVSLPLIIDGGDGAPCTMIAKV